MTDTTKSLLLGTDATGSSYHDIMKAVTVHSLRRQAGYVAPVMTGEGTLPVIRYDYKDRRMLWGDIIDLEDGDYHADFYGWLHYVICSTRLCQVCNDKIQRFYAPHVTLWTELTDGDTCECCGGMHHEEPIPF